jgi:predicted transposase/invertase (TIGR01784 family)
VLRNLNKLERVPDKLREQIFDKLFETAEIARFTQDQVRSYEDSLKYYRDLKNSLDTARDEGKIEGKIEVAKNLLLSGVSIDLITKSTGLSENEIKKIQ